MTFAFHPGELEVQRRAGESDMAARVARGVHEELPDAAVRFLAAQPFVAVASTDGAGRPSASLLTGAPGFLRVVGPRTLVIDALPGADDPLADALARSAGDGGEGADVSVRSAGDGGGGADVPARSAGDGGEGAGASNPGDGVAGAGASDSRPEGGVATPVPLGLLAIEPATRRRVRINGTARRDGDRIVVTTAEVYANCPKYISARLPVAVTDASPRARVDAAALSPEDVSLIGASDAFFIASAAATGADVSHRGGTPGFLHVTGPSTLSFPDYAGNAMFMTLGNLTEDPRVSLLVVDWEGGDVLRIDGEATIDWSPERASAVPGARRMIDVEVAHVAGHPGASPLRWRLQERSKFNP